MREYRDIVNEVCPDALLGTFHCPWTDTDYDGALRDLRLCMRSRAALPPPARRLVDYLEAPMP